MTEKEKKAIEYFKRRITNKKTAYTSIYFKIEKLETVLNLIQKQDSEINKLKKRISDLEYSLMDMVGQFADETDNQLNTMGLSALETAFTELDLDNPTDKERFYQRYAELEKEYFMKQEHN